MSGNIFKDPCPNTDIVSKGTISIGSDVWIGAKSTILSGSIIGHGCVIGANSVVKGQFPPYSIIAGSPGRVVRMRFDENSINKLLELNWWNWSKEKLNRFRPFFSEKFTPNLLDSFITAAQNDEIS